MIIYSSWKDIEKDSDSKLKKGGGNKKSGIAFKRTRLHGGQDKFVFGLRCGVVNWFGDNGVIFNGDVVNGGVVDRDISLAGDPFDGDIVERDISRGGNFKGEPHDIFDLLVLIGL